MKRKGYTLVEVIVAFAIFAIVLAGITSTFAFTSKMQTLSDCYVHFETICLDIDTYSTTYGRSWDEHYYGERTDGTTIYYTDKYEVTASEEDARYSLSYEYVGEHELYVNVVDTDSGRVIIRNLNYGGDRYEVTP